MNKLTILLLCFISLNGFAKSPKQQASGTEKKNEYTVAAYVWPSCHNEPIVKEALWSEGIGEWEIIKKGTPKFEGHYQPQLPLWGYRMDNDPLAWEQKISAASDHGVNTFIFDWYWYNGKPLLEEALDNGFLGARNTEKMNFYVMWANHKVDAYQWNHFRYTNGTVLWPGTVDWNNYKTIVDRVIKLYFKKPNYLKINGEPVFSICNIKDLISSFNGLEGTQKALQYFREEVKKAGFPGLHIQLVVWAWQGNGQPYLLSDDLMKGKSIDEAISYMGFNSVTTYHWPGPKTEDYLKWGEDDLSLRQKWDSILSVPYFPNVSVGYDDTPRFPEKGKESVIHYNNTPESFAAYLQKAKEYADAHPNEPKFIVINAWNEWVEGSHLEPDMKWGYGYLNAVKKVMDGEYDKYSNLP